MDIYDTMTADQLRDLLRKRDNAVANAVERSLARSKERAYKMALGDQYKAKEMFDKGQKASAKARILTQQIAANRYKAARKEYAIYTGRTAS